MFYHVSYRIGDRRLVQYNFKSALQARKQIAWLRSNRSATDFHLWKTEAML